MLYYDVMFTGSLAHIGPRTIGPKSYRLTSMLPRHRGGKEEVFGTIVRHILSLCYKSGLLEERFVCNFA
jgi:hypothetical protein